MHALAGPGEAAGVNDGDKAPQKIKIHQWLSLIYKITIPHSII
jgi:hypothetical protein